MIPTPTTITVQTTPVGLVKKLNRFSALTNQKTAQSKPLTGTFNPPFRSMVSMARKRPRRTDGAREVTGVPVRPARDSSVKAGTGRLDVR